jgi:signal transduction histidine kinase
LKLEGLKANYGAEPAMMHAIDEAQQQALQIDREVSFLTWELRPTALDNLGLRNALGSYVVEWSKNYGIAAEFHTARLRKTRLTPNVEINLYRIAQEALNNALKHARATKVDILLEYRKEEVVLIIEDNGRGFDLGRKLRKKKDGQSLGLIGMRERAALLGGTLVIESSPGAGTTVIARVPMKLVLTAKRK